MNQGSQRPCSLSMKKVPCLVHHQEEIQLLPLLHQLLLLAVNTTYVLVLSGSIDRGHSSCHSQIDWFEDLLVDKTFHLILDLNVMIYFLSI